MPLGQSCLADIVKVFCADNLVTVLRHGLATGTKTKQSSTEEVDQISDTSSPIKKAQIAIHYKISECYRGHFS